MSIWDNFDFMKDPDKYSFAAIPHEIKKGIPIWASAGAALIVIIIVALLVMMFLPDVLTL